MSRKPPGRSRQRDGAPGGAVAGRARFDISALPSLGTVALIGRPNVGKSSIFNRLVGGRPALVEDRPGVTRDRRYGDCAWDGSAFRVVDTGGLDPSADGILGAMRSQTLMALEEADVVVFVIDGVEGPTGLDEQVAQLLRRAGKPTVLAVNKVDSERREGNAGEAHGLGFRDTFYVSASHGRGVGELLDQLVVLLKEQRVAREENSSAEPTPETAPIRVAFAGKPNAGKSSLVNRLLGEDRVLVHHEAGTTRDPIDTPFSFGGREFVLVDTAGLRKRSAIKTLTDAVAGKMARDQIERADVVVLVVDLETGASDDDARLASTVEESGRALVVAVNKSDKIPRAKLDKVMEQVRERLQFVSWASIVVTSALTGKGVSDLPDAVSGAFSEWTRRIPTPELNRHLEEIVTSRPPPAGPAGRHIRLYFITQAQVRPPTFFISTNLPAAVPHPYRRFLLNKLRAIYGFPGTPLQVAMRAKSREDRHAERRPPDSPHGEHKSSRGRTSRGRRGGKKPG